MDPRFEQFIKEKKYLDKCFARYWQWYRDSLKSLHIPTPGEAALKGPRINALRVLCSHISPLAARIS